MENKDWDVAAEKLLTLNAQHGLPESVFLTVSAMTPIANVDLLIMDNDGNILLTRRSDPFFGDGWHIPGGCIRFKETFKERIHATAISELGAAVIFDPEPIAVKEVIIRDKRDGLSNQNCRAHHIALLFRCSFPNGFVPYNKVHRETDSGYIKWFPSLPQDLLKVHDVYKGVLTREMDAQRRKTDIVQENNTVAICVPTCDKPYYLRESFERGMLDIYKKYGIDVYVYDSSSDGETEALVCGKISEGYTNLFYIKLPAETYLDTKILQFLQGRGMKKKYKYIWPCRDTTWFGEDTLKKVLAATEESYDVIVLNPANKFSEYYPPDIVDKEYCDIDNFFHELGWYVTGMACRLFRRETLIDTADWLYISEKYRVWVPNGTFIEIGFLFEQMSRLERFKGVLLSEKIVFEESELKGVESHWRKNSFQVWGDCWPDTLFLLPSCYTDKESVINKKPHLSDTRTLYYLRKINSLNFQVYRQYKDKWGIISDAPRWKLLLISILPRVVYIWDSYKEERFKERLEPRVNRAEAKLKRLTSDGKPLIIYGAGIVGTQVAGILKNKGYNILCFAVSKKAMDIKHESGYEIREIKSLRAYAKKSVILIAAVPRLQKEIKTTLRSYNFRYFVAL